eukprot:COSAG06_NODE_1046_length_10974_cov_9.971405_8_plen_69_part_00
MMWILDSHSTSHTATLNIGNQRLLFTRAHEDDTHCLWHKWTLLFLLLKSTIKLLGPDLGTDLLAMMDQ